MARLNIEDEFILEVTAIAALRGVDPDKLAGNALRFFRYAQEKHKSGKYVSEEEFKALGFMDELFPLFSKRTEAGIEAAGSERFFGWLERKIEAGSAGGKRSAEVRKAKYGSAQPKHAEALSKQNQANSSTPEPSSSSSSSKDLNLNTAAVEKPTRRKRQLFKPESLEELRAAFDAETIELWTKLYPDDGYRSREALRAWDYYRDNGPKRPTTLAGWKRVLGKWFERGWPKHAASLAGSPLSRYGGAPQSPRPIRYESASEILARQEASREPVSDDRESAAAKVRELLTKSGINRGAS